MKSINRHNTRLNISICDHCGLIYLNPRWTAARYLDYYQKEYDLAFRSEGLGDTALETPFGQEVVERIAPFLDAPVRSVLDIGAGTGAILKCLHGKYPNMEAAYAIEASDACQAKLASLSFVRLLAANVDNNWRDKLSRPVNLVVMRHVLEHFMDPSVVLSKVHSALASDGFLYLAVPDMLNPIGSPSRYWFRVAHVYYFSRHTLLALMAKIGFVPIHMECVNSEIWGLFRKSDSQKCVIPAGAVTEQMKCISAYLHRWRLKDMLISLHLGLRSVFPRSLKSWIPQWLKKVLRSSALLKVDG